MIRTRAAGMRAPSASMQVRLEGSGATSHVMRMLCVAHYGPV